MRASKSMTAEELLRLELPGLQAELVRGNLVVREPPGAMHGSIAMRIAFTIKQHADLHRLGTVFAAETGFRIFSDPDTVRAPDVAFVRAERLPDPLPSGYLGFAPDLAVEVLSPADRSTNVLEKVNDWILAGTLQVWVIDPVKRSAWIYRADGHDSVIAENDELDGEAVLPGLRIPLSSLFG